MPKYRSVDYYLKKYAHYIKIEIGSSGGPNMEDRLKTQIDSLKVEIQTIIDKTKHVTDDSEIRELGDKKRVKMQQLEEMTKSLRQLHIEAKKRLEFSRVSSKAASMEYHALKTRNSPDIVTKMNQAKEARQKATDAYFEYVKTEADYLKVDPPTLPGMLFLHEKVISTYGLCPYVSINTEDPPSTDKIHQKRKEWLDNTNDSGAIYYDLFADVYNQQSLDAAQTQLEQTEKTVLDLVYSLMNENQADILKQSLQFIQEYVSCKIKTKRMKERYKLFLHNLSVLYAETGAPVHEYLSTKHNMVISVNSLKPSDHTMRNHPIHSALAMQIETYKHNLEDTRHKLKYITNTKNNLKNELYMFMTKQKGFGSNHFRINSPVCQTGKYHKRWTALAEEEKKERFHSFARFFIHKNMVQQNILGHHDEETLTSDLLKLLWEGYADKKLAFRDFSWNTKRGVIDKVKTLRYNQEKQEFYLEAGEQPTASNKSRSKPKKCSTQTVVTKSNARIINEEILDYIVRVFEANPPGEAPPASKKSKKESVKHKDDKDKCIERIKTKLQIKRISASDKEELYKTYDNMYEVIQNNHNDH